MRGAAEMLAAVLLAATAASAQPLPERPLPPPFVPMRGEDAFERQTVRGAPFSARTQTELVQRLADGNRIAARWTGFVARDSAGRVRREQPLAAIGTLLAAPGAPPLTVIVDPVARVTFFLDSDAKRVRRMAWPAGEAPGGEPFGFAPGPQATAAQAPSVERLGTRETAGVSVQGMRSTWVIAAGQVGNERPLTIVSERWTSAELGIDLETRHSDPRFGETRFRLMELQQAEPERALFEVPAGWTLEDGPPRPPH